MTTLYSRIRARVIEAVPDVMRLQHGCRVLIPDSFQTEVDEFEDQEAELLGGLMLVLYTISQYPRGTIHHHLSKAQDASAWLEEIPAEHILGRTIRLSDVLAAYTASYKVRNGILSEKEISEGYDSVVRIWNLLEDDLQLQEEETLELVASKLEV